MKKIGMNRCQTPIFAAAISLATLTALAQGQMVAPVAGPIPAWAYTIVPPHLKPPADTGVPQKLPGTPVTYTWTEIRNLFSAKDWFPGELPKMPEVVAQGRKPDVFACGMCHYPNGRGKPENASLAGQPAAYIVQQMADYKSGLRRSSEPKMGPPSRMLQTGQHATEAESKAAAEYYSRIAYTKWIRVVETDTVPVTEVILGSMLAPVEGGGSEPIGNRIIETAEDLHRVELRDQRVGFVAYVPKGSIAKGEQLATSGGAGKTVPCSICHGKDLRGLGDVPGIAGRGPTYLVRQLYDMQSGARKGSNAQLMKEVVARLTLEDMIALSAYAGSREP